MLAELSIIPIGKDESISSDVAKALRVIDESGIEYKLNPMSTVFEGNISEILAIVKRCHEVVMEDSPRTVMTLIMDDRKDVPIPRFDKKIVSVEKKLGKHLKK